MRYLLAISLAILPLVASACWHPWTPYNNTTLFRLEAGSEAKNIKETNCRLWQELTSRDIPLGDIEYVVYKMPIAEYESICATAIYTGNNAFMHWIKSNDREIVDFLLLAKRNEEIRCKYLSKWYYPTMKVGGPMSLEDVVEQSIAVKSERLRDRYLLQAVRALTTLGRYDECLALWDNEISLLPESNFFRRLCYQYIGGAYYHTGDVDKAMLLFASYADTGSMHYIADRENMDLTTMDIINYAYRSGSTLLARYKGYIRDIIVDAETFPNVVNVGDKPVISDDLLTIRDIALKASSSAPASERAEWLYIAAYIYMQQGDYANSKSLVAKCAPLYATEYLRESIAVLEFYLDVVTSTYNAAFEERLHKNIVWCESNLRKEIDSANVECMYYWYNDDDYYWYNSLMRILSYTAAPRYFEIGDHVRALQLKNYCCYILYDIVPYMSYGYYYDGDYYNECTRMDEFRRNRLVFNYIDYSNEFFVTIDAQTPDAVMAYVERVKNPVSEFDRYLNGIGYTSLDYLYDIVGTLCLRHMRYEEAERYFSLVSLDYEKQLNVMLKRDPFKPLNKEQGRIYDFRYNFASTMASLERGIANATDPDRRAKLLFKYGVGMANSVNNCWPLTRYGRYGDFYWEEDAIVLEARNKGIACINEALQLFTTDELKAEAHYALGHFYTVATKYSYTEMGQFVWRHCDYAMDYTPSLYNW